MLGVGFFVLLMKFILNEGNGNIIPSRWQSLVEGIYNFMMETTSNNVGPRGQAYFRSSLHCLCSCFASTLLEWYLTVSR